MKKKLLIHTLILMFGIQFPIQAQALFDKQSSENTYIFKLTNQQAFQLYKETPTQLDNSFFTHVIDSFPIHQEYTKRLPQGHYIQTSAKKNIQESSFTSVQDFDVFVLNNAQDLIIQVRKTSSEIISDAKVFVGKKQLYFSPDQQAYFEKKSNAQGILSIAVGSHVAYYQLSRAKNASFLSQSSKKLAYDYPTKYLWLPIEFVAMLPFDTAKSIEHRNSVGKIKDAEKAIDWLVCLFDSEHYRCNKSYRPKKNKQPKTAYFALNKPKFKPGDTVKGKFYSWDYKNRPLTETITLELKGDKNKTKLTKALNPYRKGAYSFEFVLHDSLNLKLDKSKYIYLFTKNKQRITTTYFKYEDYELSNQRLAISSDKSEYYRGEEVIVSLDAFDANEHRLQDAKAKLVVLSNGSDFQATDMLFIPDTLWKKEVKLATNKTTEIRISDSIFMPANMGFKVHALLQSSDFDTSSEQMNLTFKNESQKITHQIIGDSLRIEFQRKGKKVPVEVNVEATDFFGNLVNICEETTPFSIPIEAMYSKYILSTRYFSEEIKTNQLSSGVTASLFREGKEVKINVLNPKKLFFNYSVFKGNKEIDSGSGTHFEATYEAAEKLSYYVNINYLWAGKNNERNFVLANNDKELQVEVTQPSLVYPGKKASIEVSVKDNKGNPVENADVLAYGFNKKFNANGSTIKNYSSPPKLRKFRNSFSVSTSSEQPILQAIDLTFWNELDALQEKEYYQLAYPENDLYRKEIPLQNAPTQFAPFIVNNGEFIPVHILKVNKKPVYFSDMTNIQPYSFAVEEHPVSLEIRTKNKLIVIDSIVFKPNHKSIISLDLAAQNELFKVENAPEKLTESELKLLRNFVLPYKLTNNSFSYIENSNRFHLLQRKNNHYHYNKINFAGPILQKATKFVNSNSYALDFQFEKGYEYQFLQKHLKQTSITEASYPTFLENQEIPSFLDLAFTEEQVALITKQQLNKIRSNSDVVRYPYQSDRGKASLRLSHQEAATNLYIVNLANENDARIYRGSTSRMFNFEPGKYRLFILYPDESYRYLENLELRPNGTTYLKVEGLNKLKGDVFSRNMSTLIEGHFLGRDSSVEASQKTEQKIRDNYENFKSFFGEHHLFEGKVMEEHDIPLPGVEIRVEGTNYGTQSDFDGNFQLRVPIAYEKVSFSYLGFESKSVSIYNNSYKNIRLTPNVSELNEVVITSYGGIIKHKVAQAFVNSEISAFQNKDVGYINNADIIRLLEGKISGIAIYDDILEIEEVADVQEVNTVTAYGSAITIVRGKSSVSGISGKPLAVINGVPFYGEISSINPNEIKNITVLKDANATAIYGNQAKNGVLLITTEQESFMVEETDEGMDEEFITEASQAKSTRKNFNDEAFWEPKLSTNKEGKVEFSITYPDNVTSWDTYFLVATEKQQTGSFQQNIKSFKPVMAQLYVPRFLVEGDTLTGLGKVRNFLKDSIKVNTSFSVNEELQFSNTHQLSNFISEDLKIIPTSLDSLRLRYELSQPEKNYVDGEELNVPVLKKGIRKVEGEFYVLGKDEVLPLSFSNRSSEVRLRLDTSLHSLLEEELKVVINYQHECNEQLASRLKAELMKRKIDEATHRATTNRKEINALIKSLQKNQQQNKLWGWWANSTTNWWASLQVIEALQLAKNQGFKVKVNFDQLKLQLENEVFTNPLDTQQIQRLQVLDAMNSSIDFIAQVRKLLQLDNWSTMQRFQLWELFQKHGGKVDWEEIEQFQKENMLRDIYFDAEGLPAFHPFHNQVQLSMIAYRMLRKKDKEDPRLEKIRFFLLKQRGANGYANTYESISVVNTLIDDISWDSTEEAQVQISKNGNEWEVLEKNTNELMLKNTDNIKVKHNASLPVFVNHTQNYWDNAPKVKEDKFKVNSIIKNKFGESLLSESVKAGEEFSILLEVEALYQASYVMLEIPIPSGTSYINKKQYPNETHRSYAKDRVYVFIENLSEGKHEFEVQLMPRYEGSYTLNPSTAKLMYFEQNYGNNAVKRIKITP